MAYQPCGSVARLSSCSSVCGRVCVCVCVRLFVCMLVVVCCLLFVVCYLLFVICYLLHFVLLYFLFIRAFDLHPFWVGQGGGYIGTALTADLKPTGYLVQIFIIMVPSYGLWFQIAIAKT